jgi:hypothetical protein
MRPSRIAIAVFLVAALAMIGNEARLERVRLRTTQPGYTQAIHFKDSGRLTQMFVSNSDQRIRLGLVAIILAALGSCAWLERRGR